jgi:acyl carrier protein
VDENTRRVARCFMAVFPDQNPDEVTQANANSIPGWDSVANVTLLAVVEEEFGIMIDVDDLTKFDSFDGILKYVREAEQRGEVSEVK